MLFESNSLFNTKIIERKPGKILNFAWFQWVRSAKTNAKSIIGLFYHKPFGVMCFLLKFEVINHLINQTEKKPQVINHIATGKGYGMKNGSFFKKFGCFFGGI